MPASDNEAVAVSHKKSKKSKKVKVEAVEEVEEQNGNGHELQEEIKQIIEEGVTEEDENLMVFFLLFFGEIIPFRFF